MGRRWTLFATVVVTVLIVIGLADTISIINVSAPSEGDLESTSTQPAIGPVARQDSFPDASSTGVPKGTVLRSSPPLVLSQADTIIDSYAISGPVIVAAPNVRIRRSRITGTGADDFGVRVRSGNVVIEDSEISGFANAIGFSNWKAFRVNIHSVSQDGVKLGSEVTLQDSYLHDFLPEKGAHVDGAQMESGATNVLIRHNYIDPSNEAGFLGNSAIFLSPTLGPSSIGPVIVEQNLLGGGNFTIFNVDGDYGKFFVSGIQIKDNRIKRNHRYGAARTNVAFIQFGNVWDDTGEQLRLGN